MALLHPEQQVVRSLLTQLGVNPDQIQRAAEEGLNVFPKTSGGELSISPELSQVFDAAGGEAERMKDQYVSVEHLLLGLAKVKTRAQTLFGSRSASAKRRCFRPCRRCAEDSGWPIKRRKTSTRRSNGTGATWSRSHGIAGWTRWSAGSMKLVASSRFSHAG